jgi:hypothetical protein
MGESASWVGLVFIIGSHCGMVTSPPAGPCGMGVTWVGFLHKPGLFSGHICMGVSHGTPGLGEGELGGLASSSMSVSGACISEAIASYACGSALVCEMFSHRGATRGE